MQWKAAAGGEGWQTEIHGVLDSSGVTKLELVCAERTELTNTRTIYRPAFLVLKRSSCTVSLAK